MSFSFESIPDLTGKTIIVTGGNAGLGYKSALEIAKKNANVIIVCRSKEKAEKAIAEIKQVAPASKVEYELCQLDSLETVKSCAERILAKGVPVYALMNNAGIFHVNYAKTKDGLESQFAVNHLSHFYLTLLLLPALIKYGKGARVVNISSDAYKNTYSFGVVNSEDKLNDEKIYNSFSAYGQSKLANILFTKKLSDLVKDKHGILVNCCHPGFVATEIQGKAEGFLGYIVRLITPFVAKSVDNGALTQTFLTTAPIIETQRISGKYYSDRQDKFEAKLSNFAESNELKENLWAISKKLLIDRGFIIPEGY